MNRVLAVFGDDVSTDVIYPGRYMATVLPSETPRYAFADEKDLHDRLTAGGVEPGSLIVAGKNFGCGSSREQAVSCLKGHGLIVVARSVARIFLQNAVNLGLPCLIVPTIEARPDDAFELTPDAVVHRTSGRRFPIEALPAARRAVMDAGGLIPYTRHKLIERHLRDSKKTILM